MKATKSGPAWAGGKGVEVQGAGIGPGKRTLTEALPVQQKLRADPAEPGAVSALAAEGVSGPGSRLPHLDRIQTLFGRHNVTDVRAHTDANARDASERMGAEGYATGRDVGFSSSNPSLHTAAHEAAHVVQQRAGIQLKGGVGEAGDAYEQHADRVADLVVAGKSAESELSTVAGGGSTGAPREAGVQQKLHLKGHKEDRQRALAVMNKGLFGFTAKLDKTHHVVLEAKATQGKANARQQAMHDYLDKIISDPAEIVIHVRGETRRAIAGNYNESTIDMQDIEALAGGPGETDIGSLIHELVEQYFKQVKKMDMGNEGTGAHHEGIEAENAVNGTIRGPSKTLSSTQHKDGTVDAVVEIPYTCPDGRVVTMTITIVKHDITKVERKITKPGEKK